MLETGRNVTWMISWDACLAIFLLELMISLDRFVKHVFESLHAGSGTDVLEYKQRLRRPKENFLLVLTADNSCSCQLRFCNLALQLIVAFVDCAVTEVFRVHAVYNPLHLVSLKMDHLA